MIINYDSNPKNSVFYTASCLYSFITNQSNDFDAAYNYFVTNVNKNQSLFYYSLDYLFLLNKINKIEEGRII